MWLWSGQSNTGQRAHANLLSGTTESALATPLAGTTYSTRVFTSEADAVPDDYLQQLIGPEGNFFGHEMSFSRDRILDGHRPAVFKFVIEGSDAQNWVTNSRINDAITYFDAQLAALAATYGTYTVKGLVWDQGESEDAVTVLSYGANLTSIIGALWTHYGNLPLVMVGQPASVTGQTAQVTSDTQAARATWAAAQSGRNISIVSTADLPYENNPHWDYPSVPIIGHRIATAFAGFGL